MAQRTSFKEQGKKALQGKWCMAAVITIFTTILPQLVGKYYHFIFLSTLTSIVFSFGTSKMYLMMVRGEPLRIHYLFHIFHRMGNLIQALLLSLLLLLTIGFGFLLLIIPGVVFMMMFSQSIFILVEDPSVSAIRALKQSKKLTEGHKLEIFCLCCYFLGGALLCIIFTLGIGLLWFIPYMNSTFTCYYLHLKSENEEAQQIQLPSQVGSEVESNNSSNL